MSDALERAIELNRDRSAPPLRWDLNVGRLVDARHLGTIEKHLAELGRWETRKATPLLWQEIPATCGVYMFVWRPALRFAVAEGDAMLGPLIFLYVGRAGGNGSKATLSSRYQDEYSGLVAGDPMVLWSEDPADRRDARLARYLSIRPLEFWWCSMEAAAPVSATEELLIRLLNPPLNDRGRAQVRMKPPVTAF